MESKTTYIDHLSRPQFLSCGTCKKKNKRFTEIKEAADIDGLKALYVAVCSRCRSPILSIRGDVSQNDIEKIVDMFKSSLESGL